jgi:hypothetical protein
VSTHAARLVECRVGLSYVSVVQRRALARQWGLIAALARAVDINWVAWLYWAMAKAIRANQEYFDLLAGDIFARLYTHFPEPTDLHTDVVELPYFREDIENDPGRLEGLYRDTIRWLADEGYLRFTEAAKQDAGHTAFLGCVLTSKGLSALRKTPGSLAAGETIGDKIRATAKDIGSDTARDAMKKLVGAALGWIFGG